MSRILVSGLVNLETTLQVERFPIEYSPVTYPFFGIRSGVSGVGYNITRALTTLGSQVELLAMIGTDSAGDLVRDTLAQNGIPALGVLPVLSQTPQSVVIYDAKGMRQVNTDLKDIQEHAYPEDPFDAALSACNMAVLTNINFSRPFLSRARQMGKPVVTDVHVISSLDDPYNADFMRNASVLFMSDEGLPCPPEEWARLVLERFGTEIIVVGLGVHGALLSVRADGYLGRVPAVRTREIVSTVGAGDALLSAFVHFYSATGDPYEALKKAVVFASYKIGSAGAGEGFLTEGELNNLLDCLPVVHNTP